MPRKRLSITPQVESLGILDANGRVDADLDPKPDRDTIRRILRAMLLGRRLDERMIRLQRTGRIGTYPPLRGQEAAQIGSVFPLTADDWVVYSYREAATMLWRGWPIENIIAYWGGSEEGNRVPEGINDTPYSVPVGSQALHAVGIAYALRMRGSDAVVLTYFGDGATSQGDVLEAMNFAGVWQAPVIFVCQNNQYAISVPLRKQTASETIAQKALAFGFGGIRVDGNDVLAMMVATSEAVERARRGGGPTLIEAFTYRMDVHTTADDWRKYRSAEEVEEWAQRDPIERFIRYARRRRAADDALLARYEKEIAEEIAAGVERFEAILERIDPLDAFRYVYASMPPELQAQQEEFVAARQTRAGVA